MQISLSVALVCVTFLVALHRVLVYQEKLLPAKDRLDSLTADLERVPSESRVQYLETRVKELESKVSALSVSAGFKK